MKSRLQVLLSEALEQVAATHDVDACAGLSVQVDHARDSMHGDYASNIAMVCARHFRINPRQLAEELVAHIAEDSRVEKIEVAGPGFINFYLRPGALLDIIPQVLDMGSNFGSSDHGKGKRIMVEFVSANPTGPLHIGHGRGAAYGDSIASLLLNAGFDVDREYYVNDAGRQMDILAISIWLKYLLECGLKYDYPANAYQAAYIGIIAREIHAESGDAFKASLDHVFDEDWPGLDAELQLDLLIDNARQLLGEENFRKILDAGLDRIINTIRSDLEEFGVRFDNWFSENSLAREDEIRKCVDTLQDNGKLYTKDGALWFTSLEYGDEKDRVVMRDNGKFTYFASDIAYHKNKFARGYDRVINIWGADHHGYIKRVKASLDALGINSDDLDILLVQFATLYRGGDKMQMSTRSGEYVTLKELVDEVGVDAARFFYVMRRSEQHLDFDLDLAKSESSDNPVYYIQYAHARICSVWRQMQEKKLDYDQQLAVDNLALLDMEIEQEISALISRYEETLLDAALTCEPHKLCFYLMDLSQYFHSYYNTCQFLVDDRLLRYARLALILSVKQVICNGLAILGVSAPEEM